MRHLTVLLLSGLMLSHSCFAQTPADAKTETPAKPAEAPKAEPIPPIPHYSTVLPVHIQPRQTGADSMSKAGADIEQAGALNPDMLGLIARASDGGLGGDIWKGYTSKKLADDLSKLNLNIASPVMRDLLSRALLTTPDTGSFPSDPKDSRSGEALAARLETLIDLGSFADAVSLYKKLEGNVPSSKAALAGAEGLVGTGQMGLACLEEKAVSEDLKKIEGTSFWPDLKSFCQILLTTDTASNQDDSTALVNTARQFTTSKKLAAPATLKELNGKSVIEILALDKASLLPASLFTVENVEELKPQVIALLLNQNLTNANEKLSLLSVAVEKGLKSRGDLETEYLAQAKTIQPGAGAWNEILSAYNKLLSAPPATDKSELLKAVLTSSEKWPHAVLPPFANQFALQKDTKAFSPEQARKVIGLLIEAKTQVSGVWGAAAFKNQDLATKESITDQDVIQALQASDSPETAKAEDDSKTPPAKSNQKGKKSSEAPETIENAQLHVISLILNSQEVEDKPPEKSYENLLSLTASNDYVMPSMELMNNLKQASLSQDTGKVILYSLQALNGQRVSQMHPAVLFRITEGLQSVGLSEEIRSLAHEALADLIEDKKVKKEN